VCFYTPCTGFPQLHTLGNVAIAMFTAYHLQLDSSS
jgi:hypothetical protein